MKLVSVEPDVEVNSHSSLAQMTIEDHSWVRESGPVIHVALNLNDAHISALCARQWAMALTRMADYIDARMRGGTL